MSNLEDIRSIPYKDDPFEPTGSTILVAEAGQHFQMLDEILDAIDDFSPQTQKASYARIKTRDLVVQLIEAHSNLVDLAAEQGPREPEEPPQTEDYDYDADSTKFSCF